MNVPGWYALVLLALGSWRTFQLIGHDDITEGLRRYVTRTPKNWDGESPITAKSYRETLALFIQCPYCAGFWIALVWWVAWQIWPHGTLVVAAALAINAGLIAVARFLSAD